MKKNKDYLILFIITLIFSLYKIVNVTLSYDTDILIIDHKYIMDSWIGISRFGLVFLKYIFHLYENIDIRLLNILTYINIYIYNIIFLKFLKMDNTSNNILKNILSITLIITSPILLEQYYFTLQAVEVSFSMILMTISFITTYKYLKDNKLIYAVITIPLLVICFGTYQSFINLYLIGLLMILYKLAKNNNIKNIIKSISILFISVLLYFAISKISINVMNIDNSTYLSNRIGWFNNVGLTLYGVIKDFIKVIIGYGHVLNLGYTMCLIIIIIYLFKDKKISYKNIYLILMLLVPFALNAGTGSRLVIRSMFTIPFLYSFVFYEFYDLKYVKYILIILILSQVINSYLLMIGDYQRYINDIKISEKIYNDCDNSEYIYLYGIEKSEENINIIKGEAMGYSYYEWDDDMNTVSFERVYNFNKIHNINYKIDGKLPQMSFEGEYPNDGYIIKIDNKCYVNLGK